MAKVFKAPSFIIGPHTFANQGCKWCSNCDIYKKFGHIQAGAQAAAVAATH